MMPFMILSMGLFQVGLNGDDLGIVPLGKRESRCRVFSVPGRNLAFRPALGRNRSIEGRFPKPIPK